jgi:hypothetical protein
MSGPMKANPVALLREKLKNVSGGPGAKLTPAAALGDICKEIAKLHEADELMHDLFAVLERFPDTFLGAPGPVVRALEAIEGYEDMLRASVRKKPTMHTLAMMMRIVNACRSREERRKWNRLIRTIADDESLGPLSEEASAFLSGDR